MLISLEIHKKIQQNDVKRKCMISQYKFYFVKIVLTKTAALIHIVHACNMYLLGLFCLSELS